MSVATDLPLVVRHPRLCAVVQMGKQASTNGFLLCRDTNAQNLKHLPDGAERYNVASLRAEDPVAPSPIPPPYEPMLPGSLLWPFGFVALNQ